MKRGRIYLYLLGVFVLFFVMSYLIKGKPQSEFINTILSISSFIFGVILAFSIANRHSRLSTIREKLREQDAILLNIYELSRVFGNKILNQVRDKIDQLLISQIDYKLIDFDKKSPQKIEEFMKFIEKLKVKTKLQEAEKEKILEQFEDLFKMEKEVSLQTKNHIMFYEWISLLILGGIIIFSMIFYVNVNTPLSIIVTSLLETALVLLLLVLRDLDSLEWQEQNWIWQPLSNLFVELKLVPYIPEGVFKDKRISYKDLEGIKKIRIAKYPHPYPNMKGKKIELIKT